MANDKNRGASVVPRYGTDRQVLGLPPRAVALTNSERGDAACDLRWLYRHGLGYGTERVAVPLAFGAAAHEVMEDVWGWWAAHDAVYEPWFLDSCAWCATSFSASGTAPAEPCRYCGDTMLGPIPRIERAWREAAALQEAKWGPEDDPDETLDERVERLRRCVSGYLLTRGHGAPPAALRVVGVEVPIARSILGPGGKPYAPECMYFRLPDGGYRFARVGDDPSRVEVQKLPWYYVGIVDVLLASRETGALFVGEHKFSIAPETLISGLTNDPQTAGYCWALESVLDELDLPPEVQAAIDARGGKRRVGGFTYMVNSSSMQHDPLPLKGGGFSTAKNRRVPSWRFEAALAEANRVQHPNPKMQPHLYAAHIADLRSRVDPRLYRQESGFIGEVEKARFASEIYGVAVRHARMRRDAWRESDPHAVMAAFPRAAVCRLPGGSCTFRGPCAAARTRDLQDPFVQSTGQVWYPDGVPNPLLLPTQATEPTKEKTPCPF